MLLVVLPTGFSEIGPHTLILHWALLGASPARNWPAPPEAASNLPAVEAASVCKPPGVSADRRGFEGCRGFCGPSAASFVKFRTGPGLRRKKFRGSKSTRGRIPATLADNTNSQSPSSLDLGKQPNAGLSHLALLVLPLMSSGRKILQKTDYYPWHLGSSLPSSATPLLSSCE